ncbi:MAG: glycosyltransferase family 4 protein [Albidovulum sp.]|uniref:glycosyltransferase family 4 protein n=1 Tax=Albidovulum sp. TaxID=1872424 RepID=UPI003C8D255B
MDDLNVGAPIMKVDALERPAIRTFMEMPGTLAGVSMTCRSILTGAAAAGVKVDLFTSYLDGVAPHGLIVHTSLPRLLQTLPYGVTKHLVRSRLRNQFLDAVSEGDIAYLWPSTPLHIYEALAARGVPIVVEAVNTRMATAKPLLDAAYDALGFAPGHGITEARIAEQNTRQALCRAVFTPSPATEQSMRGTVLEHRIIPTSYGTWVPKSLAPRPRKNNDEPVTFLFLGRLCVRKGAHFLLDAWRRAPKNATLRIVGDIEPALRTIFADVLDAPNVRCVGFTLDIAAEFARADVAVLPSLEEGDPIATYEAAAHGLPVIASAVGAGRIGSETGAINIVDPSDAQALRQRFEDFAASEELRRHWGDLARSASLGYDWNLVAPLRMQRLFAFLKR